MSNNCFNCGCKFDATRSDQLFCSKRCRYRYHHRGDMVISLNKKCFDMILSGEQTEKYIEMKPYMEKRFINYFGRLYDFSSETPTLVWKKQQKDIVFCNGYGENKPQFIGECSISEGYGKEEWGAKNGCKYYILKIHRIYGEKNIAREIEHCK